MRKNEATDQDHDDDSEKLRLQDKDGIQAIYSNAGMGNDGLQGCKMIASKGGVVIAQDEPSSVVWGMPGHVVRAGIADTVLSLDRIGPDIAMRICRQQK